MTLDGDEIVDSLQFGAPARIRRAQATYPITALQTEYSLATREVETEILDVCGELGIGFVAYGALGRGLLTGTIAHDTALDKDDIRLQMPRFQGANRNANLALVARLQELARGERCTPSQLAIAWVLAQGKDIVPIPGTKRRKYLEENLEALEVRLEPDDLAQLDEMLPHGIAQGARYAEGAMKAVNG